MVLQTRPTYNLDGTRAWRNYYNELWFRESSTSEFMKVNKTVLRGTSAGTNFKEMAGVYEYSGGSDWKVISKKGNINQLLQDEITEPGTYVETGHVFQHTVTHEWNHGLGEIVTAVLDAGLVLTGLALCDPTPAWEPARQAYRRARSLTRSPGVVMRAVRLLNELLDGVDSREAVEIHAAALGASRRGDSSG